MSTLLRVMTFNVNGLSDYEGPNEYESANTWANRAQLHYNLIARWSPDLIGLQEVTDEALATYRSQLTGYASVTGNRYGDTPPQEQTPIFWKQDRFMLVASGEFWFSRTPDVESSDFGLDYPMGATWVKLAERTTGAQLVHLNTHFEDSPAGEESRVEAAKLIVARLGAVGDGLPAVITGDFNCNAWSQPYRTFVEQGFVDTYRAAGHADSADSSTFHGFHGENYFALEWGNSMVWRVDWIMAHGGNRRLQTLASAIVRDAEPPRYPSDHYPVVSEFLLF